MIAGRIAVARDCGRRMAAMGLVHQLSKDELEAVIPHYLTPVEREAFSYLLPASWWSAWRQAFDAEVEAIMANPA